MEVLIKDLQGERQTLQILHRWMKGNHVIELLPYGGVPLHVTQLSEQIRIKVRKGELGVFDICTNEPVDIGSSPVVEVAGETPVVEEKVEEEGTDVTEETEVVEETSTVQETADDTEEDADINQEQEDDPQFKCDQCDYVGSSARGLATHKRAAHKD